MSRVGRFRLLTNILIFYNDLEFYRIVSNVRVQHWPAASIYVESSTKMASGGISKISENILILMLFWNLFWSLLESKALCIQMFNCWFVLVTERIVFWPTKQTDFGLFLFWQLGNFTHLTDFCYFWILNRNHGGHKVKQSGQKRPG